MMMKSVIGVALLVSLVNCASLYGGGNFNGAQGNVSVDAQIRGFKAVLYLFAPDSWITTWNAVPEEGQECFISEAADPANTAVFESDDIDKIKQLVQSQCQTGATQLGSFLDAGEQTIKSLPATFLADSKAWATQAQALGEQFKQAAASGNIQQLGSGVFKQKIAQFSSLTADFTAKVAAYSDADRQQIAAAFPKLSAFISGDQAVKFLNEITALYKTLGAGNLDANALKTQAQQLKPTLQAVWQQYKTQNADGLKQASQLMGKDLSQAESVFNAQAGASANSGGFNLAGQASQGNSDLSNAISQRVEQGKEKLDAGREKFQAWLQNAKENTQEGWQDAKEKASQGVQQLKQKVNEFKQEHSANGQASLNGNGAAAGINVN